ncbi:hypothetical protein O6H91_20G037900 [Diphasiastrum complanatum]|uniref:Uncharacterized protein n=1 Tax=Diphasiastrum complanatum TaxID=34168 RepID=A0ACC2APF4_DIPCM|nr:hypothetical protein O6H91_20G037900 [Diphasiastrum complanatum]
MHTFRSTDVTASINVSHFSSHLVWAMLAMALTCWVYVLKQRRRRGLLPPGPCSIPVLGNLHQLGVLFHQALHELSKKYGPLMYLRLGSIPFVVVSSSKMAREVLKVHDLAFASRPRTTAVEYLQYDGANIVFAPYGADWRLKRKVCTLELLTSKRLQQHKSVRMEEICVLLKSIYEDSSITSGSTVNVSGKFGALGLNIVSRMMLNKRIAASVEHDAMDFKVVFDELLSMLGAVVFGDLIPYLAWFDPHGYKRSMKRIHQRLDSLLEGIIHEHEMQMHKPTEEGSKDLLHILLNLKSDGEGTNILSRTSIKGIVQDMLVGGSNTSSHTLNWAMAELLRNPTLLQKAQIEIATVVGHSRKVDECDISELKFLRAIVRETFRLHPALPMLVPRESLEPCEIAGYSIPRATRVFVNAWAIGRDPSVWPRPLEFNPERFLLESSHIDVLGHDFELLPFGSGRRGCPGIALGLCMVQHTLACLLHCFDWCLPQGQIPQQLDMQEAPGIVLAKAKDLIVVPTPREVAHLYIQ